jgi:hypothetical protein
LFSSEGNQQQRNQKTAGYHSKDPHDEQFAEADDDWEPVDLPYPSKQKVLKKFTKYKQSHSAWEHEFPESDHIGDHPISKRKPVVEAESPECFDRDQDQDDEEDDDFNLSLLVPKSFDHDPDYLERTPTSNSSPCAVNHELIDAHSESFQDQLTPAWKKNTKPCLAESQSTNPKKLEGVPFQQNPMEKRKIAKQQTPGVSSDKFAISSNKQLLCEQETGSKTYLYEKRSNPANENKVQIKHQAFKGDSKLSEVMAAERFPKSVRRKSAFEVFLQCAEYSSIEIDARTRAMIRSQDKPSSRIYSLKENCWVAPLGDSAAKGESKSFLFCSTLLNERVSNYRLNTRAKRISLFH